jgi:hypothetical protein
MIDLVNQRASVDGYWRGGKGEGSKEFVSWMMWAEIQPLEEMARMSVMVDA